MVKSPKTRTSIRVVAIDEGTLQQLERCGRSRSGWHPTPGWRWRRRASSSPPSREGLVPPHPDTVSHAFTKVRNAAKLPKDLHLHSLRHFQATSLDAVIPERQKQARLGWSTVHMARHYTDAISSEDQKAAEHIGSLLDS